MAWKRMLAYLTGTVDRELLLRNEYLLAANRILRRQLKGRLRLTDPERKTLAEIARRLGRKALREVATLVTPETLLGWYRKLILLGEGSLRKAVTQYIAHHQHERPHQGLGNAIPLPRAEDCIGTREGPIRCRERLGGLLKYYHREVG